MSADYEGSGIVPGYFEHDTGVDGALRVEFAEPLLILMNGNDDMSTGSHAQAHARAETCEEDPVCIPAFSFALSSGMSETENNEEKS